MSDSRYFFQSKHLSDADRLILFYDRQIIARGDSYFWGKGDIEQLIPSNSISLLVDEGESRIIAIDLNTDISQDLSADCRSLRSLIFVESDVDFSKAGKANQIVSWYKSHQYCGTCGAETKNHANQRALYCSLCQEQYFPRINPCAIVLVTKGRQVLLARSARFRSGFFSCLAGFIEVGETVEETVRREIKEEVGVTVGNIRYIKSQSWPFPSQLMLGFHADYVSGEIVPEPGEIEEANWFDVENLPVIPSPSVSVAGELIKIYTDRINRATFELS